MGSFFKTVALALTLATGCLTTAQAQTKPVVTKPVVTAMEGGAPSSLLYVGNSFFYFNNGINGHMSGFVTAGLPAHKLRSVMVTISGSGVDWHDMRSYFRPNALSRYSFDPQNNVVFNKFNRLFDAVMFMDCSQCPIHPTLSKVFESDAARKIRVIRRNGAVPVLFASWAYQDKPEMSAQLQEAYVAFANKHKVLVVPAGLAWTKSLAKKPDLALHIADKRHPTLAGTYLATATAYAAIFGQSPVGNKYTAGLDAATAAHLQQVAWEAVQEFYKK